jgi:hypothetical protein
VLLRQCKYFVLFLPELFALRHWRVNVSWLVGYIP